MNTYGYVGGNPLRYSDPLGLVFVPSSDNWQQQAAEFSKEKCAKPFWQRVNERWGDTNKSIPPFLLGIATSKHVAKSVGGMTFMQAIKYWGTYQGANAFVAAGMTSTIGLFTITPAFEAGLYGGSAIYEMFEECKPKKCGED